MAKNFTIGCDPEFLCVKKRRAVVGEYYIETDEEDEESGPAFGRDGNGITLEVRPAPSKEPLEVVSNIHKILQKVSKQAPFSINKWYGGSYRLVYPLGGHIHFGIYKDVDDAYKKSLILDNYVGAISLLIEDTKESLKRRNSGYGNRTNYREQPWGFEYRTPSSWLSCPYVTTAMLCLAKTVIYEAANNPSKQWPQYFTENNFRYTEISIVTSKFNQLWQDILQMKLYQEYKPYIDVLYWLVKNNKKWYPINGMKQAWGLFQPSSITIGTIWRQFNRRING